MSIYNWGFNNFYINSFMPMPYWGGCGCNAFNSGFRFGILNSLFNYNLPQMNAFSFAPQFSMQLFNPYNNIFAMTNNYIMTTFSPALYNFSIPTLFSQLNTFNNYTEQSIETGKNNNFNILIKNKKTNYTEQKQNTTNITRTRNTTQIEIDTSFQNSGKLDINFLNRVKQIANKLNCDYRDLLALMNSESGIKTSAWNGNTAVGLIQFTNASISELNQKYGLNLSKEKIAQMSPMEQLDLVEKYLTIAKSYSFSPNAKLSAGDLYAITFLPGKANQNILSRNGDEYYKQNKGLDINKDGIISKKDLELRLAKKHVNESIFS